MLDKYGILLSLFANYGDHEMSYIAFILTSLSWWTIENLCVKFGMDIYLSMIYLRALSVGGQVSCSVISGSYCWCVRFSVAVTVKKSGIWRSGLREILTVFLRKQEQSACLAYSLIMKIEAVHSSETSVNFYRTTRRHIPEGSTVYCWILKGIACPVFTCGISFCEGQRLYCFTQRNVNSKWKYLLGIYGFLIDFEEKDTYFTENKHLDLFVGQLSINVRVTWRSVSPFAFGLCLLHCCEELAECGLPPSQKTRTDMKVSLLT
jgi:hypothetical protein